jgi:RNA polymerase sigma-70 factor (ECF subfamily)
MLKQITDELLAAYGELRGYLVRRLGDPHAAADVAQASFEKALAYGGARSISAPRALLFQTARNLCVDRHRHEAALQVESFDAHADNWPELPAPSTSLTPETALSNRQLVERVAAAIEALPPKCREAFMLHKLEGVPHHAIARKLGVSRSAVEKYVIRGMNACREAIEV